MQSIEEKIQALDLVDIKKKLCNPPNIGGYSWPKEGADEVEKQYKQFLLQSFYDKQNGKPVTSPPSTVVDIFWHMHILFTKKYHADCKYLFGYYLHHDPYNDPRFSKE